MRRKTANPALVALLDERQKTTAAFERTYSRFKRTFNRLDKLRKKLARLSRKMRDMENTPTQ
jgi:hypothetical protein